MSIPFDINGLIPISWSRPTFATPIFTRRDSNAAWRQEFDDTDLISGFVPVDNFGSSIVSIVDFEPPIISSRQPGQKVIYGFYPTKGRAFAGEREEITARLSQEISEGNKRPFIAYSIARFIGDEDRAARALRDQDMVLDGKASLSTRPFRSRPHLSKPPIRVRADGIQVDVDVGPMPARVDHVAQITVKVTNLLTVPLYEVECYARSRMGLFVFSESSVGAIGLWGSVLPGQSNIWSTDIRPLHNAQNLADELAVTVAFSRAINVIRNSFEVSVKLSFV